MGTLASVKLVLLGFPWRSYRDLLRFEEPVPTKFGSRVMATRWFLFLGGGDFAYRHTGWRLGTLTLRLVTPHRCEYRIPQPSGPLGPASFEQGRRETQGCIIPQ